MENTFIATPHKRKHDMEKSEKTWGGWITVVLVINFN
jgi:hypothetical protein